MCEPALSALSAHFDADPKVGGLLSSRNVLAPLPRAYEWVDGSAYINHIVLVRKARGAEPPRTLSTDPLVYQGGSGVLLGPHSPIELLDDSFGLDFEAEICVILGDTPQGVPVHEAEAYIRLVMLCNDITYRNLIPPELEKGFGFFNSKPATAFSPFAVTPDELGGAFRNGRLHASLLSSLNGADTGHPDAGPEMHFSFFDLIAHITKTRAFTAGTILGSGTVSNQDPDQGVSCLAERRMREVIESGQATTPFLKVGDRIRIEARLKDGSSPFGVIEQEVARARKDLGEQP
jgi:fumarylacetoacetate (FAA) hydrolase